MYKTFYEKVLKTIVIFIVILSIFLSCEKPAEKYEASREFSKIIFTSNNAEITTLELTASEKYDLLLNKIINKITGKLRYVKNKAAVSFEKLYLYENFLLSLKQRGFTFWDFNTFIKNKDKDLPEKLLVIRHDVHYRDITYAYKMIEIEKRIIGGAGKATYYVMLNFPPEENNKKYQKAYTKLIKFLHKNDFDVQPHISPVDEYIKYYENNLNEFSFQELSEIFNENYRITRTDKSRKLEITGKDVLNLKDIIANLGDILNRINTYWRQETGLEADGYAAHGSSTNINRLFNNAVLLDLECVPIEPYYDTYQTWIGKRLTYLSDNNTPEWIKHSEQVKDGRYQLLAHPAIWSVNFNAEKLKAIK